MSFLPYQTDKRIARHIMIYKGNKDDKATVLLISMSKQIVPRKKCLISIAAGKGRRSTTKIEKREETKEHRHPPPTPTAQLQASSQRRDHNIYLIAFRSTVYHGRRSICGFSEMPKPQLRLLFADVTMTGSTPGLKLLTFTQGRSTKTRTLWYLEQFSDENLSLASNPHTIPGKELKGGSSVVRSQSQHYRCRVMGILRLRSIDNEPRLDTRWIYVIWHLLDHPRATGQGTVSSCRGQVWNTGVLSNSKVLSHRHQREFPEIDRWGTSSLSDK